MSNESFSPPGRKWRSRALLVFSIVLPILLLAAGMALAHGGIVLDGALGDWCFPGQAIGIDTKAGLTPPGCPIGNEVLWRDASGDAASTLPAPPVDILSFTTTADSTNVYFAIAYTPTGGPAKHFQIAIDYVPNGTLTWRNPAIPPAPIGLAGFFSGNAADFLIVVDTAGINPTLWEGQTFAGVWTPIMAAVNMASGSGVVEISIPWTSFTCGSCAPFVPGTIAQMTVLAAYDDTGTGCSGLPGAPCNIDAENDIFSEAVAGTFTTSPTSCVPGTPPLGCELADGSADAFITVNYQAPTAVDLDEFENRSPRSGLVPVLGVLVLVSGLALITQRRKKTSGTI
jgi:hypothetical protein